VYRFDSDLGHIIKGEHLALLFILLVDAPRFNRGAGNGVSARFRSRARRDLDLYVGVFIFRHVSPNYIHQVLEYSWQTRSIDIPRFNRGAGNGVSFPYCQCNVRAVLISIISIAHGFNILNMLFTNRAILPVLYCFA
jgi:hypothetical protein